LFWCHFFKQEEVANSTCDRITQRIVEIVYTFSREVRVFAFTLDIQIVCFPVAGFFLQ
jgi:hypothetical protein